MFALFMINRNVHIWLPHSYLDNITQIKAKMIQIILIKGMMVISIEIKIYYEGMIFITD